MIIDIIKLYITNIIRKLKGKHPVSDLYYVDSILSTEDLFRIIANRNIESILICVDKSRKDDKIKYNIKTYLDTYIDNDSISIKNIDNIKDIILEHISNRNEQDDEQ